MRTIIYEFYLLINVSNRSVLPVLCSSFCFATGLSTSQPNHLGPGDPDGALSARDRPATGGGGLPVLPQRLNAARLPLQGPPRPIRDPDCERLLPPEGLHRKHHEVWTRLRLYNQ